MMILKITVNAPNLSTEKEMENFNKYLDYLKDAEYPVKLYQFSIWVDLERSDIVSIEVGGE